MTYDRVKNFIFHIFFGQKQWKKTRFLSAILLFIDKYEYR